MAQVKFRRLTSATLPQEVVDGQILFLVESKELYMGSGSKWVKFGDGDNAISNVAYNNGTVTVTYNDDTAKTFASLASVSDTKVDNQFVTDITATNGVVTANRSGITASQITRTATAEVGGTTVEDALSNLASAIKVGGSGSVVTVETPDIADDGYLKTYVIKQGDSEKGRINIPKDLVVTSGTLVNGTWSGNTFTEATAGDGRAIKLVIANQETPIYINTTDLVDIYTAGAGITITENKIAADLGDGLEMSGEGDTAKIAVKKDSTSESYLTISANGVKVSGIDNAISTAVNNSKKTVDAYTVNGNSLNNDNWQVDGGDINVDDDATTKETIATAITRLTTAASNASDKVDTEIAKLDGNATADGAPTGTVTRTSTASVLFKVNEVDGVVKSVGDGEDASKKVNVDAAGAANAAYNDAVAHTINSKTLSTNPVLDGTDIKLTSYTTVTDGNVTATDSVNSAINKLETKVVAAETALTWIEA